jgi:hypothetical protein
MTAAPAVMPIEIPRSSTRGGFFHSASVKLAALTGRQALEIRQDTPKLKRSFFISARFRRARDHAD